MNKLPKMKESLTLSDGRELKLTRPKVAAIRLAEKKQSDSEKAIALMSICTNMTEAEIDELELVDYTAISGEIDSFLVASGFIAHR